ncbi:hypothetical protein BABINDRAFT_161218 [Babjeviella inositovora NRRL Y-12698]|uniref:Nicotinamide-nucleotide adenylyltransferase n=1 Tax=Babjeviella inositovora NRRL Y-12698 TaxID=984486 RepID=A0A1E3QRD4_9ASCO|nr:uncharacterized protein BABINDRAFT_161218 [Babjeviella inositovora NRRL Y-12698]ODQ80255.1 hypothetical protein BABINDRAFT_161218 [Babjeviella inositovora NRRL Y-12698]
MNRDPKICARALCDFLTSGSQFRVIYLPNPTPSGLLPTTRLCILDSSFNPPHNAHLSLVVRALQYNFDARAVSTPHLHNSEQKRLMIMLSVNNADKTAAFTAAAFEHRIAMMCLLADQIRSEYAIETSVGLTTHAKFVDKSQAIISHFTDLGSPVIPTLTFLAGFDTLIRIFNPKYYAPSTVEQALGTFMQQAELFTLTRDKERLSIPQQWEYVKSIQEGKLEGVPQEWYKRIFLVDGLQESIDTSSSGIRKLVPSATDDWKLQLPQSIAKYIQEHGLYKD